MKTLLLMAAWAPLTLRTTRHTPRHLPRRAIPIAIVMAMLATAGAFAQKSGNSAARPGKPSPTKQAGASLDPNPYTVEQLGLTINLPLEAAVVMEKAGGEAVVTVTDCSEVPAWSMRIQSLPASLQKQQPTAADQIEELLRQFRQSNPSHRIIANSAVEFGGVMGQLCYLEFTASSEQKVNTGWLVLPRGERVFLAFSLQTLPEHFSSVRALLEASFATMRLRSADQIVAERRTRLEAGRSLLQSITPERLKSLVGLSQWYRLHAPEGDGHSSREIGYSLLEVTEGKKGALNPHRSERTYDADARKVGLLVRIHSRLVGSVERGVYYDAAAIYWMAWDQSEETWSIVTTQRQGEAEVSESETGIRTPALAGAAPILKLIQADNSANDRKPSEWIVPDIYLSQPLHWLLGKLLPKEAAVEREFSYYFYNFVGYPPQLSQRVDTWGPANDGSGHYRLVTKLSSDAQPMIGTYDRDGGLVRRTQTSPAGTVITEPISVQELTRIWKSKGLPVGKIGR